jgi:glutamine---fructose-6-phosphate transaminase (isomerizing)
MCGIVGYISFRPAAPILIDGLKKLEYRGYDSAGIVICSKNNLRVIKKSGSLEFLERKIGQTEINGNIGLGHTRWATHGEPSDCNAHPHVDCRGKLSLVHNGIIENYQSLRSKLKKKGHNFLSETDTEVLIHLIEEYYRGNLFLAVKKALTKVRGSYALAVLSADENKLICARKDSPLIIGAGEGENFVASDAPALLRHTRQTYIMEDNEMAIVQSQKIEFFDSYGQKIKKKIFQISGDGSRIEKEGYDHFMIKEIMEQPKTIADTLKNRINLKTNKLNLSEFPISASRVKSFQKIHIVACGTSAHAGWIARHIMENILGINVEIDLGSEFRYRNPLISARDLVIVISQSGETADTLAALRLAKKKRAYVLGITNVVGSSVAREANEVFYTRAGPEIAVASTKAYTAQLTALYLLSIYFGRIRRKISSQQEKELLTQFGKIPRLVQELLTSRNIQKLQKYALKLSKWKNVFFIGRGLDYVAAMEGALKLKEISYIHAEAYPAGELKHGTLALIEKDVPVIALITQAGIKEKTLNNVQEVIARKGKVFVIANTKDVDIKNSAHEVFLLPRINDFFAPIISTIPMQLIAYYVAVAKNCSVDKPRNLAKSVTVE